METKEGGTKDKKSVSAKKRFIVLSSEHEYVKDITDSYQVKSTRRVIVR